MDRVIPGHDALQFQKYSTVGREDLKQAKAEYAKSGFFGAKNPGAIRLHIVKDGNSAR